MKSTEVQPSSWSMYPDLQKKRERFYDPSHTGTLSQWLSWWGRRRPRSQWPPILHRGDEHASIVFMLGQHHEATASSNGNSDADQIAVLRQEQERLLHRIKRLENKLDELLSRSLGDDSLDEAPLDPYERWIQDNLEQLRQYPDSWVALILSEESYSTPMTVMSLMPGWISCLMKRVPLS